MDDGQHAALDRERNGYDTNRIMLQPSCGGCEMYVALKLDVEKKL